LLREETGHFISSRKGIVMRFASFAPALLVGFFALPGFVGAQDGKAARTKTDFQPVASQDLRHGQVLEVTTKGSKVRGTLVRADADRLYLRTQPGAAPTAVARQDAEIRKEVRYTVSKDDIKVVGTESDVIEPEIQSFEIINGGKRIVTYTGQALSSGERSMLLNLQNAENEMAQLQSQVDRQQIVIENAIAMQTEQRNAMEQQNRYMEWLNQYLRRQDMRTDYWTASWGYGPGVYGYLNWPQSNIAVPWLGQSYGAPLPVIQQTTATVAQPAIPAVPADALTKASANLAAARNAAIFERNRLVAVVVTDK
jgi:hypothetical protein